MYILALRIFSCKQHVGKARRHSSNCSNENERVKGANFAPRDAAAVRLLLLLPLKRQCLYQWLYQGKLNC